MKRVCIAVVDAAGARLFQYEESNGRSAEMREIVDLSNPGRRERETELFKDSKGSRAVRGGWGSTDDHRGAHIAHWDREFAKAVVGEVDRVARDLGIDHVILTAPPKMLGDLRRADGVLRRPNVKLDEVARDLMRMSASEVHDHLATFGMIQPRHRAQLVQR